MSSHVDAALEVAIPLGDLEPAPHRRPTHWTHFRVDGSRTTATCACGADARNELGHHPAPGDLYAWRAAHQATHIPDQRTEATP